ncbi:NUDIX hydrolase [archaeon]|nr:NUDIX hydrolase [archaeon]MBL7057325.1 NUDIX hydrolase [Candidatus Woesearchaeota archaeon]
MEQFSIPIISAIIERTKEGETEILVQTRWKPESDPKYTGCLEIPAGKIDEFENVYETVKREVLEETGLKVLEIYPNTKTKTYSPSEDGAFAFQPFCCQQQIKGGNPYVGFVFICKVEDKEPKAQQEECKDTHWIKKSELKKIFEETPEKIFSLQLGVLEYYFNHK